ncbi:MAG TPA: thermonuclease family protein [Chloroflexota bacterium]|nr:thermonuclease family protein [Chloroflexota bacterium]
MPLAEQLWTYRCTVERVIDGDTSDVYVDAGFRNYRSERLRLLGVNTPELRSRDPEDRVRAQAAKAFVEQWLQEHREHGPAEWPFVIRTQKSDAFGRFLCHLECAEGHELNQTLLDTGHATVFED